MKQTAFHHNIVYDHLMQPASDTYSFHMGIYRDAHVVFEKCYSNIYLNTDEDPDFAGKIKTREKAYFIQNASTGISYAEDFNNMFLTYRKNGQKDLVVSDYPGGRMFLAGVNREGRFLHNIEQTAMNKTILADDFVLEKGSVIENGIVKMQNRGDSIVSDSVYMSPGTKQVKMSFNGDKYDVSVYCFNLEVINNDNVVFTKSMYISGGGSALTDIAEKTLYIPQDVFDGGYVKLRLQAKDDNCLTFTKLVIDDYTGDIPEDFFPDGARILTAGEAIVIKTDPVLQFMRNIHQTDEFRNNSIAKIGNTTLSYTVTTDKINAVQVMMSTSLAHSNGRLLIYDENETLLCVIDLKEEYLKSHGEKTEWLRINAKREFLTELPAGEHTIKLVFKRNSGEVFAPDFNNIAFYKTLD